MGCVLSRARDEENGYAGDLCLEHFKLMRALGKGSFGKVRLVNHRIEKRLYALKYFEKETCYAQGAASSVLRERNLLAALGPQCPFICTLRYAFQDPSYFFMVLDPMFGGDLRFHLDRGGGFSEQRLRFYMATLTTAVSFLHSKNVVHRDIKPDNILLDASGYAHLTDFNVACTFDPNTPLRSVAGSLAYMAPEMLSGAGYSYEVDYWSLGVVCFEMLTGKRPFRGRTPDEVLQSIQSFQTETIQYSKLLDCNLFIKMLLDVDPKKRLGSAPPSGCEIRDHVWFKTMDWDALRERRIRAPFVPSSKQYNFDSYHELEEMMLDENPLTARKSKRRSSNVMSAKSSPESKRVEEQFAVYDYRTSIPPPPSASPREPTQDSDTTKTPEKCEPSAKDSVRTDDPETSINNNREELETKPRAEMIRISNSQSQATENSTASNAPA